MSMKLSYKSTEFVPASKVAIPSIYYDRMRTGVTDIDNFLGCDTDPKSGILRGGVYILAAGAGSGKSTFCLQLAEAASKNYRVAYASGEESIEQLAFTCKRLNVTNVPIAVQPDLDTLIHKMASLDILIIDSFQSLTVRKHMNTRKKEHYCIEKLCEAAKRTKCAIIALCHITKQGSYKGTTTLLHAADALININIHEEIPSLRVFSWGKNRFGPTDKAMELELSKSGYRWSSATTPKQVIDTEDDLLREGSDIINNLISV